MQSFISNSTEETENIAASLAKDLIPPAVICLQGDLGAGKTAFVRGLAKGLGVTDTVSSPTFTLVNQYSGSTTVYHFDLYRLDEPEELYDIGIEEYLNSDAICVIEWPELIRELLPKGYLTVNINKNPDRGFDFREITIKAGDDI